MLVPASLLEGARFVGHCALVLRRPRPAHKRLAGAFARPPVAEKVSESNRGEAVHRDRSEEREYGLTFAHLDAWNLLEKADVPASSRPFVLLRLFVSEEESRVANQHCHGSSSSGRHLPCAMPGPCSVGWLTSL
jgi:hypothetical protein